MIPASMGLRLQIPADVATFTVTASWGTYESIETDGVSKSGRATRGHRPDVPAASTRAGKHLRFCCVAEFDREPRMSVDVAGYLIAGHQSAEPGSAAALRHRGLHPVLDLGLRLGEGSRAALAIPIVQAAAKILREMASFDDAEVSSVG